MLGRRRDPSARPTASASGTFGGFDRRPHLDEARDVVAYRLDDGSPSFVERDAVARDGVAEHFVDERKNPRRRAERLRSSVHALETDLRTARLSSPTCPRGGRTDAGRAPWNDMIDCFTSPTANTVRERRAACAGRRPAPRRTPPRSP